MKPEELKSLGLRTDLIFPRFEGVIRERGRYLVVETPSNPGFIWGNLIVFDAPPAADDYPRWTETFRREFARSPRVRHMTFAWDGVRGELGEVQPFLEEEGFRLEESSVMTARQVQVPQKVCAGLEVRPLATDSDWAQAIENQIACRAQGFEANSYREFKAEQMARYRRMERAGLGYWFGAFLGERLVGDLGLFRDGEIGRFQSVGTAPEFRRQGVCGTMVERVSNYGFTQMGLETLVMIADPTDHAFKIYASVGFEPTERIAGVCLRAE